MTDFFEPRQNLEYCSKIKICHLDCEGCHGVYPEEKTNPQHFLVEAEILLDTTAAIRSDEITDTLNYSMLARNLQDLVAQQHFQLLEKLAFELCRFTLASYPQAFKISLSVEKKPKSWQNQGTSFLVHSSWQRNRAVIALGSNLGNRKDFLLRATDLIKQLPFTTLLNSSTIHESKALLYTQQPDFLNQCVLVETLLLPSELLTHLQKIEQILGRQRNIPKGPRTIDLDIILYENLKLQTPTLTIPHAGLRSRRYLIEELADFGIQVLPENMEILQQECHRYSGV